MKRKSMKRKSRKGLLGKVGRLLTLNGQTGKKLKKVFLPSINKKWIGGR